jgi:hypothetical protein
MMHIAKNVAQSSATAVMMCGAEISTWDRPADVAYVLRDAMLSDCKGCLLAYIEELHAHIAATERGR